MHTEKSEIRNPKSEAFRTHETDEAREIFDSITEEIADERHRQEALRIAGKFPFTCASPHIGPLRKLPILVEEAGEIATEVYEYSNLAALFANGQNDHDALSRAKNIRAKLRTELIQLAAVAVAWVESIDTEQSASPLSPLSAPSASPREK